MADLSDVNMEGVTAMTDYEKLPIGQYLTRIEDTDKVAAKEKFDSEGAKLPQSYYLQVDAKVYGGPNDEQVEKINLNLWNTNEDAVRMAKSELKAIQDAVQVFSPNSDSLHGKWMVLEVKEYTKRDQTKATKRVYHPAPEQMVAAYAHIPPVPAKAPKAATQAAQPAAAGASAKPAAAAGSAGALPAWAQKKTA